MPSSDPNQLPIITFVTSNKKKRLLVIDGYVFQRNKSTEKVVYWTCEEKMCDMGVHLSANDEFIKFTKSIHTHMPAPEKLEIRNMLLSIKDRVNREKTCVGKIYTEELSRSNLSTTALALANTSKESKSGLHRIRRHDTPVLPCSVDFDIPSSYTKTVDKRRYLLSDRIQHVDENLQRRLLVFATDEQLRFLYTSPHIMMDGTFSSCPSHFDQVYSIHALKNGESHLCVIALLCGRSSVIYKELFAVLFEHARRLELVFNPQTITTDFEAAMIKTIADEFPNARHIGCYFHFSNAIIKQIQSLGLTTVYRDNADARCAARQLMALPLTPLSHTQYLFNKIVGAAPKVMKPLIDYFESFWIRKMRWNLWNVYGLEHKTNNHVEGWNHRFNRLVDRFHPNVWHLFDCFRTEEVCMRQKMLKVAMGGGKGIKKKTNDFQKRFELLQSRLNGEMISIDEYFQGMVLLLSTQQ